MITKVGLMGIGHNLFRILYKRDDIQVTATATLAWFPGTTTSGLFRCVNVIERLGQFG
jgi:hypothetical protein